MCCIWLRNCETWNSALSWWSCLFPAVHEYHPLCCIKTMWGREYSLVMFLVLWYVLVTLLVLELVICISGYSFTPGNWKKTVNIILIILHTCHCFLVLVLEMFIFLWIMTAPWFLRCIKYQTVIHHQWLRKLESPFKEPSRRSALSLQLHEKFRGHSI